MRWDAKSEVYIIIIHFLDQFSFDDCIHGNDINFVGIKAFSTTIFDSKIHIFLFLISQSVLCFARFPRFEDLQLHCTWWGWGLQMLCLQSSWKGMLTLWRQTFSMFCLAISSINPFFSLCHAWILSMPKYFNGENLT